MSLSTPPKLRKLQRKLYAKAKDEPEFRFYALYDKIFREDILYHAWKRVRHNSGAPGVDGVSLEEIEQRGVHNWLDDLQQKLKNKEYEASPVRRVRIPKPDGGERPLGIPTVEDRVVQMATKLVIEPIFEVDLEDNAYGYRPKRSALDAIKQVHQAFQEGYTDVVDADLSSYFDTIPHDDMIKSVSTRISDGSVLELIKMWLKAPIIEEDENGSKRTESAGGEGTPQGGVISPLLANLYMNRFLKFWSNQSLDERLDAKVVNYADDFVILTRSNAEQAYRITKWVMDRLGLTLNKQKTSLIDANEESFEFLGYEFGWEYSRRTGNAYPAAQPSSKSVKRLKRKIGRWLKRDLPLPFKEVVAKLNQILEGWANYFCYGTRAKAYQAIDHYTYEAITSFIAKRHKVTTSRTRRFTYEVVYNRLGVTSLRELQRNNEV